MHFKDIMCLLFSNRSNNSAGFRRISENIELIGDVRLLLHLYILHYGPGSSVDIAMDYGLDGPGSNPGGDEIFRLSRQALGLTQPPVQWVPGFLGGKVRPGRAADH